MSYLKFSIVLFTSTMVLLFAVCSKDQEVKLGKQKAVATDKNTGCDSNYRIIPMKGFKKVTFGMTEDEIETTIGKPENFKPAHPDVDLGAQLDYSKTQGFMIRLNSQIGKCESIFMFAGDQENARFTGCFPNGISLKSNRQEIINAFGEPSGKLVNSEEKYDGIEYSTLGLNFIFEYGTTSINRIIMKKTSNVLEKSLEGEYHSAEYSLTLRPIDEVGLSAIKISSRTNGKTVQGNWYLKDTITMVISYTNGTDENAHSADNFESWKMDYTENADLPQDRFNILKKGKSFELVQEKTGTVYHRINKR